MGKGGNNNKIPEKKADKIVLPEPEEDPSEPFDEDESSDELEDDENPMLSEPSDDEQLLNKI